MHLKGAEVGYWRIDQNASFYQGWDRRWLNRNPKDFATVKYEDVDSNGFFDKISYDMDGDTTFEEVVDLKSLGIDDRCQAIDIRSDEHTSELQSLMRTSYAFFCLKKTTAYT